MNTYKLDQTLLNLSDINYRAYITLSNSNGYNKKIYLDRKI